jgi:hypothetical protein
MTTPSLPPEARPVQSSTLDYARPGGNPPPPPVPRPANGTRMIACALIAVAGCLLSGLACIAHATATVQGYSGLYEETTVGAQFVAFVGFVLFLIEFVRGWRG